MTRQKVLAVALLGLLSTAGCTVRYSQSLVGTIPAQAGTQVTSSDTGLEIFRITVREPKPAHEQVLSLMGACQKLTRVEVDYRTLFYIVFGIPKVIVTANCVQ